MLLIDSYIDINRCHPKLSMDLLIKEKKTHGYVFISFYIMMLGNIE